MNLLMEPIILRLLHFMAIIFIFGLSLRRLLASRVAFVVVAGSDGRKR